MNWITNFVRPKLQAFVGKKEVPDNLWETCPKCSQMLLKRELIAHQFVCKHCDHHFRITAKDRLELFLGNNYMLMDTPKIKPDPLNFKDSKKYSEKKPNKRFCNCCVGNHQREKNCYSGIRLQFYGRFNGNGCG